MLDHHPHLEKQSRIEKSLLCVGERKEKGISKSEPIRITWPTCPHLTVVERPFKVNLPSIPFL
jgi:hypothetical protein